MENKQRTIVIGGGAAGMMAAITASKSDRVILLEKNERLGKKLYITGKGRCNVTNAAEPQEFFSNIVSNYKFMYSSFYGFNNERIIDFFEQHGVPLKTERGGRVFPLSDKSSDIIKALSKELNQSQVEVRLNTLVSDISFQDVSQDNSQNNKTNIQLQLADESLLTADKVIIATGGLSYPATGSTGDGYRFAHKAGHTVTPLNPGLVPFETEETWVKDVMGLSLKNVEVRIKDAKKERYKAFGEMIFTHYGVSGPVILSASSLLAKAMNKGSLRLYIDLKPALTMKQLDQRFIREFNQSLNKSIKNVIPAVYPQKLVPIILEICGIDGLKPVNEVTKEERMKLVTTTKNLPLTLLKLRDYNEAIITQGGISTKEVDPVTMESKLVKGLYFAGEVLDVDAQTGGFNLQIAWSTGYAAGSSY